MTMVLNYNELIAVVRDRVAALNVPLDPLEEFCGLTRGHLGKLLGPAEDKRIGMQTIWPLFEALGLRIEIHEHLDIDATIDEMGELYRKRAAYAKRGRIKKKLSPALISSAAQELGRRGGKMQKRLSITGKKLSRIRRRAAKKRWSTPKIEEIA